MIRRNAGLRNTLRLLTVAWVMAFFTAGSARADISGWLGVRGGVGLGDTLIVDGGSFGSAAPPSFALGVTSFLSLGVVEVGAIFELSSAAGTPAVGVNERMMSQLRAVALLRWHFVYDTWGGAFMGFGAGLSASRMSDFVRFELVRGTSRDPEDVERTPLGLAIEAELGTTFVLTDELRLGVVIGAHTSTDTLLVEGSPTSFVSTQAQVHVGLEWAL